MTKKFTKLYFNQDNSPNCYFLIDLDENDFIIMYILYTHRDTFTLDEVRTSNTYKVRVVL